MRSMQGNTAQANVTLYAPVSVSHVIPDAAAGEDGNNGESVELKLGEKVTLFSRFGFGEGGVIVLCCGESSLVLFEATRTTRKRKFNGDVTRTPAPVLRF